MCQSFARAFWLCGTLPGILSFCGFGLSNRHALSYRNPSGRHRLYLHDRLLCYQFARNQERDLVTTDERFELFILYDRGIWIVAAEDLSVICLSE